MSASLAEMQLQLILILPDQKDRQEGLREFLKCWDITTLKEKP
jgi:hypothetical protein